MVDSNIYGRIKSAKAIAEKALGKVDLDSKVLKKPAPKVAKIDAQDKTSAPLVAECVKGKNLKSLLKKAKKVDVTAETKGSKSSLVEASADPKVSKETTKAKKAKALAKAKRADAKETKLKS